MVAGLSREDQQKYQRRREDEEVKPNDILVSTVQEPTESVKKALELLGVAESEGEKHRSINLLGRGRAVAVVVQIAEFLKRRVKGLHQISSIENKRVVDTWEPKPAHAEEGLKNIEVERTVAGIRVQLSLDALDTSAVGYQAPLPEDQVTETGDELPRTKKAPRKKKAPQQKPAAAPKGGRGSGPKPTGRGGRGGRGSEGRGRGSGGRGRGK